MTPEEFEKEMIVIRETNGDSPERFHYEADKLMCKILYQLGYGNGVKIFEDNEKWYS